MKKSGTSASGRDVVAYFAGHLAHLVNGNDRLPEDAPSAEINAFQLYERVSRALVGRNTYADVLVGVWAYPPPAVPEDAAEFYFDAVLDRPIARRGGQPATSDNLRALIMTRAIGPAPVPGGEEISTWSALVRGPARIRRFTERQELYGLSNQILKCLDAANRPYAEVLRLGLCPPDWLDGDAATSLNTLKAANVFLKALKAEMGGEVGRRPTTEELTAAWAAAPVPGSANAPAFAGTPLGAAILSRLAGQDHVRLVAFDDAIGVDVPLGDEDEPLMKPEEAAPILEQAVAAGAIAEEERILLAAIIEGRPLADAMRGDFALRRRLRQEHGDDVDSYVADLTARISAYVQEAVGSSP